MALYFSGWWKTKAMKALNPKGYLQGSKWD